MVILSPRLRIGFKDMGAAGGAMAVGPLGQVHISVRDVDSSVEFYRDVLGMDFMFRVPGQPMAFFKSGDVRLYLGTPERPEFRSKCVLYFRVDDIDAEVVRLEAAGVAFLDRPHVVHRDESSELWMVFLTDPDDHQIGLMEERRG
jgi:catechol 2,3-dioxygenase-like lactoylglutathione lyase family enzyme